MAENKIIFDFDNDNRPIRESEIEGKLFEPQYKQAMLQIESYLRELELEKTEENQTEQRDKSYTEHIQEDIDYNNNIFAFVGERGTGKTSCMISVAGMLTDKKNVDKALYPNIDKDKFVTIDLIDPAYFDKSHNLLSLFLAKLYKSFLQELERAGTRISASDKQKFLKHYREAHSQLHRLYHEKQKDNFSDEDLIEYVEEASASVNLKRTIKDLVDAYIDCFHWKDTLLILRIDDVDMDFENASEMIESMRKYFVQPNLLVFVSCSLEQLNIIKAHDFMKEVGDRSLEEWCGELADRYISKVFPQSHCIKMPEPATYHDYQLEVTGKFKTEAGMACEVKTTGEKDKELNKRKFVSVKQALLELILKKTRYLFYNTNYYESYIVPRNLRELRQLMKMLITMPDYHADGIEHPHNKTLFKEYFYGAWVDSNLNTDDRKHVLKLQSVQDVTLFNKTLITILEERFGGYIEKRWEFNKNLPITTADILKLVFDIEPRLVEEDDRKLLFFIKSYYSILLYDNYCEVLSELDENKNRLTERKVKGSDGKTESPIYRKDRWSEYYDYEKLVGGSFLALSSPNPGIVMNSDKLAEKVRVAITYCGKSELTLEEEQQILFAELLVLSIYYARVNDKDENVNLYEQWKQLPNDGSKKELVVSVGALLFNLTRYEQSIIRYNEDFYNALKDSPKYENIKKRIISQETEKNDFGHIHRVSLRNFEVLQDILANSDEGKTASGAEQFFKELGVLAGYSFPLYEYREDNKENYNRIHLTFLQPILESVKSLIENRQVVNDLFGNTAQETNPTDHVTGSTTLNVSGSATEPAHQIAEAPTTA